jgi:hypothetical protein
MLGASEILCVSQEKYRLLMIIYVVKRKAKLQNDTREVTYIKQRLNVVLRRRRESTTALPTVSNPNFVLCLFL